MKMSRVKKYEQIKALEALDFVTSVKHNGTSIELIINDFSFEALEQLKKVVDFKKLVITNNISVFLYLENKQPIKNEDLKHHIDYEADQCQRYDDDLS